MEKTHKNKKANLDRLAFRAWQRSTLPGPCGPSTLDAGRLNGRVRYGYAWFPSAIITKRLLRDCLPENWIRNISESITEISGS